MNLQETADGGSIDPRRVIARMRQWPLQVAALFGTRVAETILASVHVRTHPQAGHMNASDPINIICQILQGGGRPHMAHHDNRTSPMGAQVLIRESWYKGGAL